MRRDGGPILGGISGFVFFLPLFYFLSLGPVTAVYARQFDWSVGTQPGPYAQKLMNVYTGPAVFLHDHTPLGRPLEDYLQWWFKITASP
jgi:hypothetical protein